MQAVARQRADTLGLSAAMKLTGAVLILRLMLCGGALLAAGAALAASAQRGE